MVCSKELVGLQLHPSNLLCTQATAQRCPCPPRPRRSLKPIDRDAIAASVRKTHRVVSVEEGWPQHGVGSGAHWGVQGLGVGGGRVWPQLG